MKRRARRQVTCYCIRYAFPHRLGGGRCFGRDWCESYHTNEHDMCRYCTLSLDTMQCEVALGVECLNQCPGYREHLRHQPTNRHPLDDWNYVRGYDPADYQRPPDEMDIPF